MQRVVASLAGQSVKADPHAPLLPLQAAEHAQPQLA